MTEQVNPIKSTEKNSVDSVRGFDTKQAQSEALGKGLWKALWIAMAVCVLWLGFEGGIRLYHRPAKLDARVAELETQLAKVVQHEAEINLALKSSLENQKNLAPVAIKIDAMINQISQLPMLAAPALAPTSTQSVAVNQSLSDKIFKAIQSLGDQLVRIQVVGDVKDVALTPAAQDLVRQQLRLHLLGARLAWLSQMPQMTQEDLNQAEKLLAKHFQAQSKGVVEMQKNLSELRAEIAKSQTMKKGQ
jgi:uncharacterized protein HemX